MVRIFNFQFYVCPECDVKRRIKDSFRKHALEKHPRSRDFHQSSSSSSKKSSESPAKNQNNVKKLNNTILVTTVPLNIKSPIEFVTPEKDLSNPWNVDDLDKFLKYVCPECGDKKPTKPNLRKHALEKHPKSREFHQTSKCYVCPKQPIQKPVESEEKDDNTTYYFDGTTYYKVQNKVEDPNAKNSGLRCEFCDKFFPNLDNLEKHIVNFHGVKSIVHENEKNEDENEPNEKNSGLQCEFCDKYFPSLYNLEKHIVNFHNVKSIVHENHNEDEIENVEKPLFHCDECDFQTYDKNELPDHKQKMHRTCKHCGLCFKGECSKRRYRTHVKWCVDALQCSHCDKRFRYFKRLRV